MRVALVTAAAFSVLLAACGGVEREPNLAQALERTEATGSARLEMHVTGMQGGQRFDSRCDGVADYARRRSRLKCELPEVEYDMITIGGTNYSRTRAVGVPTGERWVKSSFPGDDIALQLSPERLLNVLRAAARETERIGEEDVRGEPTVVYRLTVSCDGDEISCSGETAPAEVWIDGDGLVRRIRVDDGGISMTLEFFDFGVEVDVEPPPADQVLAIDEPCEPGEARPIRASQAIEALRRRGFSVSREENACFGNVAAVLTNAPDVFESEGHVSCFLFVKPPADAPKTVVRRGADGADAELLLENLDCTILADSPTGEEKVERLERAFDELERAIRP